MSARVPRQLERGHFAFMRALAQGLDERASWDRYLQVEGDHADLRTVRRTIEWIRDAFAAAARREARPGTARLMLLDPRRLPPAASPSSESTRRASPASRALPTLAEFAAERGMEDFSEEEQLEAYAAAYPAPPRSGARVPSEARAAAQRASRRARLIARQLEALRWLEELVAREPHPGDSVAAWLHPVLAERLERAGLPTLQSVLAHVNGFGARWWRHVPGIGATKARRVVDWLHAHEDALGSRPGAHVSVPRTQVPPEMLASVVPHATALLPFEKFIVPPMLERGHTSAIDDAGDRMPAASSDYEAVKAWLAAQRRRQPQPATMDGAALSATQRAYRKEAERLLLWAVLERGKAMSALDTRDVQAFDAFLAAPPAHWCGPRHHQRWSPLWRPLEGPLASSARRHARKVLRSLYAFWITQGHVRSNPFADEAPSRPSSAPFSADRVLSFAQWDHLDAWLDRVDAGERGRRLRRAVRWLYATGMRLSELTRALCCDIERSDVGWQLTVRGEGAHHRVVSLPDVLVDELQTELGRHGFEASVAAASNAHIGVMARFSAGAGTPPIWSASGIYQAIKAFVDDAAQRLQAGDPAQAAQLRQASAHWLRHSHGAHALMGRNGQAPHPIAEVSRRLGHAAVTTTAAYLQRRPHELQKSEHAKLQGRAAAAPSMDFQDASAGGATERPATL